jgi:hypothetical protein
MERLSDCNIILLHGFDAHITFSNQGSNVYDSLIENIIRGLIPYSTHFIIIVIIINKLNKIYCLNNYIIRNNLQMEEEELSRRGPDFC